MIPSAGFRLSHGIEHGRDVLGGRVGQDVVHLLEHEAPARPEGPHLFVDMAADLAGRGMGEDVPRVAASAPECDVSAEIPLERAGLHSAGVDLHRIDGIQAGLDQVGQQLADPAAAVEHDLDVGQLLGPAPEAAVEGLVEAALAQTILV